MMVDTGMSLESAADEISEKASDYETATNFEAKKQQYLNDLSSIDNALGRLKTRIDRVEFLSGVLVDVLEERLSAPGEVTDARDRARSVVNHDEDYFWTLVDEGRADEYEKQVQQAIAATNSARTTLESEVDAFERRWNDQIESARKVQRLFGRSRKSSEVFSDIDDFLENDVRDDSKSLQTLEARWNRLQEDWGDISVDWGEVQQEYGLSDRTITVLKDLADGADVKLGRLDETVATELLSVDELHDVVEFTI